MKILPLILLVGFIIFYYIPKSVCDKYEATNLIRDFLLRQVTPTKVNTILCWNEAELFALLKILYKNNFSVAILKFSDNLKYPYPEENQLFITDLRCEGWKGILIKASEYRFLRHPFRWFVISNYTQIDLLEDLPITIDSRFFLAEKKLYGYHLKTPYKIDETSKLSWNNIGMWNPDMGFEYYNELTISRNRSNLMKAKFNSSLVLSDLHSLNHLWNYTNLHIDPVSKANIIYIYYLMDMLNATGNYKIHNIWGDVNTTTGVYNGMLGDVQKGLVELGGIVAFITSFRLSIIDYIAPTTPAIGRFIFRAPPLSYVDNIFILPFAHSVWLCFFVLTAFTALVLYAIVYYEWKNPKYLEDGNLQVARLRANFFDTLMVQIGGICQQGSDTEPRSVAGRIALLFSFTALMFLYTSFSANIVALLQTPSDSIKTLEDLLHSTIQLGVHDTDYSRQVFSNETEPIRRKLYLKKIAVEGQPENYFSAEEGISRIRKEFFAFHCEIGTGYKIIADTFQEHEKCGLVQIPFVRAPKAWLPMRKNSTYSEILKVRLMHERGIRNRELERIFAKKPICTSQGNTFVSVGLIDCYYGFLLFGVGFGFSITLLILEILVNRYRKKGKDFILKKHLNRFRPE